MVLEDVTRRPAETREPDPWHVRTERGARWQEKHEEENDCIASLSTFLVEEHDIEPDAIKQMTKQVKTQVRQAVDWAKNSPETPMEELYTDVYTDSWGPYTGTSKPEMLQEGGKE